MWEDSQIYKKIDLVKKLVLSERLIVYGAGFYAKKTWNMLSKQLKDKVISFAVTDDLREQFLFEIAVKRIGELTELKNEALILISVSDDKIGAIYGTLKKYGFSNVMAFDEDVILYASVLSQLGDDSREKILNKDYLAGYLYDEASLCENSLSVSEFIRNIGEEEIVFRKLPFVWGGSGILDYALLRGLFLKYKLKNYLEVGTYIGASLAVVDDLTEHCFSVTVPPDDHRHMRFWCEARQMKDYSNRLVDSQKVTQFLEDSTYFDYSRAGAVDLYFIDGDHSYRGVYIDTVKIFDHFDPENSFVVWHDCRTAAGIATEVVKAVYDAIGDYWRDFFVFDVACMCGIYIPPKYQVDFVSASLTDDLTTYRITLQQNK